MAPRGGAATRPRRRHRDKYQRCPAGTEFEPTWLQLAQQASRLEPARVNIDLDGGMQLAEQLKILDEGIPAVVVFNRKETDGHETLMAGELVELPRLLKRLYRTTKGQYLRTDSAGYFLRAGAGR